MRAPAVAILVLAGACTTPTNRSVFQGSNPAPLEVTVSTDPPPLADGVARDAVVVIGLGDYPDPDTVAFGPILLRSGAVNFDAEVRVDLVGKAIRVKPRSLFSPDTSYEVVVAPGIGALDGRQVTSQVVATIDVGAQLANLPAPAPVTWADVAPVLTGCAPYCHSRTGKSGAAIAPARRLDLTGDPADPVYGLIDVPSVGLAGVASPLLRVAPNDSARSVLLRKLLGGEATSIDPPYPEMGVDGRRMPLNLDYTAGDPLPDDVILQIERWIDDGAQH